VSKSLVVRKSGKVASRNPVSVAATDNSLVIIGAVLVIALLLWMLMKSRQAPSTQYQNEESWDVAYNEDGLPTKITIHRNAVQK